MHYALLAVFIVWFVFLAPLRVIVATAVGCLLVATATRRIASAVAGMPIGYGASIRAVALAVTLTLVTLMILTGHAVHDGVTFAAVNAITAVPILLAAYVFGFHLCLGTTLPSSILIAFLSSLVSIAIVFAIRWFTVTVIA